MLRGLHRDEPAARDFDRLRPLEEFDGAAGRLFEVEDRGGARIPGIRRLRVQDGGKRQETAAPLQRVGQGVEAHPQVVRVEERVPPGVPERLFVLGGALGGLPQHQPPVGAPAGEVPALPVRPGAPHHLHQERRAAPQEIAEDDRVGRGGHIVHIREESDPEPPVEQPPEPAARGEGGVEVGVPRRAPLEFRRAGDAHRGEVRTAEFRRPVLREGGDFPPAEGGAHRPVGGETVHEQRHDADALGPFQRDVEEGHPVGGGEQRLRGAHPHGRPQAAVHGDRHGAAKVVGARRGAVLGETGDFPHRLHRVLAEVPRPLLRRRHRPPERRHERARRPRADQRGEDRIRTADPAFARARAGRSHAQAEAGAGAAAPPNRGESRQPTAAATSVPPAAVQPSGWVVDPKARASRNTAPNAARGRA